MKNIFIILCTSLLLFTLAFPTEAKHKQKQKQKQNHKHHGGGAGGGGGGVCRPSGKLKGKKPPAHQCNKENDSECCEEGKTYLAYQCSPPVSRNRPPQALLTLNSFQKGKDGGGPSACDNKFHSDEERIVALSTGWFNKKRRCSRFIKIKYKGRTVKAKVVDECASAEGCDADHDYQPPCPNNVVDASKAVWKALGVPSKDWGGLKVTWTDA